ncbi:MULTISPECIES: hypothetical protein [unclassified Rhizobium]|uniref:hypothetical protein n=1 Tax=Rhizobium sp. 16-488-2b TaxID=2819991 RepID=UPI001ADB05E3|nr:hypothetical protein [Rhizobium sp. 16-488-2b]MBO9175451.1 hypothetical protein [Rhizobium sp. 16-488-2a]
MELAAYQGGGTLRLLATFDLEPSNLLRLYGVRLLQAPDGRRIVYAAQSGNRRTATFDPAFAEQVTKLASTVYDEATTADGTNSKAA